MNDERKVIEAVVKSLSEHPEEWTGDDYEVSHKNSGFSVWVANSYYGVSIKFDGDKVVGGVTQWSSMWGSLIPWRRQVYDLASTFRPDKKLPIKVAIAHLDRLAA